MQNETPPHFPARTLLTYGFLTWLTPFVVSMFFMTPEGVPRVDILVFKKIMLLTGALVGTVLLVRGFRRAGTDVRRFALVLGATWLGINVLLDLVILLPLSGMGFVPWLTSVGIGYLSIPIVAYGMGLVAEDARGRSHG